MFWSPALAECFAIASHSYHAIALEISAELLNGPSFAGNVSIGKFIVAYPHVRQVLVPEEGCRLVLGTDGLWDFLAPSKVFALAAPMAPAAAATALCKQAFLAQVCMLIIVCAMLCGQCHCAYAQAKPSNPWTALQRTHTVACTACGGIC